jgi:hypothetical protein
MSVFWREKIAEFPFFGGKKLPNFRFKNDPTHFSVFSVWWVESESLLSMARRNPAASFWPGTGLIGGGGWPRGSGRDPSERRDDRQVSAVYSCVINLCTDGLRTV